MSESNNLSKAAKAMKQKEILTNEKIKKDIISSYKNEIKLSEEEYKKSELITFIAFLISFILLFICPKCVAWGFVLSLLTLLVSAIGFYLRPKIISKTFLINNYLITVETVHCIFDEHYYRRTSRCGNRGGLSRDVSIYSIRFENGKTWRIPENIYLWSENVSAADFKIFETVHRGDTMIVVTKKKSKKIIVAYHSDYFEYKG